MKFTHKLFATVITLALMAITSLAFGGTVATLTGLPVLPTVGVVFAGSVVLHYAPIERTNMAYMAIDVEVWSRVLVENLFKDNAFLNNVFNADEYVLNGAVVHIPNAGAKPAVVKNRSSFPAAAVQRSDADTTYALDTYTTTPSHITKRDQETIAYDKITNILSEHIETLNEVIGDAILEKYSATAAGNIIRTTGANVAAHLASATGNRKKLLKEDIKALQTAMNKANISKADRFILLDSEMFGQLQDDADLIKRDTGAELDMKNGVIYRLYGFNVMERSSVLRYDNAGTPVPIAFDAAGSAAHNAGALAWQKNSLERAVGTTTLFQDTANPLYYGDVYSALVTMGGRIRRAAGVYAIVQAAGV